MPRNKHLAKAKKKVQIRSCPGLQESETIIFIEVPEMTRSHSLLEILSFLPPLDPCRHLCRNMAPCCSHGSCSRRLPDPKLRGRRLLLTDGSQFCIQY